MWEKACALLLAGNGCGLDQGETIQATRNTGTMAIQFNDSVRRPCFVFLVSPSAAVKCELYYLSRFLPLFFFSRQKLVGNDETSVSVPRRSAIVGKAPGSQWSPRLIVSASTEGKS